MLFFLYYWVSFSAHVLLHCLCLRALVSPLSTGTTPEMVRKGLAPSLCPSNSESRAFLIWKLGRWFLLHQILNPSICAWLPYTIWTTIFQKSAGLKRQQREEPENTKKRHNATCRKLFVNLITRNINNLISFKCLLS